jgi:transposase
MKHTGSFLALLSLELFVTAFQDSKAETIYAICDDAGYYRSRLVRDYLKGSKIELVFLPPYSPNLNLIEGYWKFFKVLYNRYYERFQEFKEACVRFFRQPRRYLKELRSLLAENFQIVGAR